MVTEVGLMAEMLVHRGRLRWRYWMSARNGRERLMQVAGLLIQWRYHSRLRALTIVLPGWTCRGKDVVGVADVEPRLADLFLELDGIS